MKMAIFIARALKGKVRFTYGRSAGIGSAVHRIIQPAGRIILLFTSHREIEVVVSLIFSEHRGLSSVLWPNEFDPRESFDSCLSYAFCRPLFPVCLSRWSSLLLPWKKWKRKRWKKERKRANQNNHLSPWRIIIIPGPTYSLSATLAATLGSFSVPRLSSSSQMKERNEGERKKRKNKAVNLLARTFTESPLLMKTVRSSASENGKNKIFSLFPFFFQFFSDTERKKISEC